jgi:cell division protein ZapA
MPEPVELKVGGRTYRVVASADRVALERLADQVDVRLRELAGAGGALQPNALLLAAISLAHDLDQERERRIKLECRSREMLTGVLARIDAALEEETAEDPDEYGDDADLPDDPPLHP